MKVQAVSIKKFLKNKNDIYKNVNIVSKRARQINDFRYTKIEAMQNIDDSEQLEELNEIDFNQEKSISLSIDELLNNELEFRDFDDEETTTNDTKWSKLIFKTI